MSNKQINFKFQIIKYTNLFFICLLAYLLIGLFALKAYALTMSNDNFVIQGDLNMSSGNPSGQNYKIRSSLGNVSASSSGVNYEVKSGFSYASIDSTPLSQFFSFSISETMIDFGLMYPTTPVTRANTLSVSSPSNYIVLVEEKDELKEASSNSFIPNTTCDNGSCSQTLSSLWTNTLTYGFGYMCENIKGSECQEGFSQKDYFKQFPNISKSESAQKVMKGLMGENKSSKITYKINLPGTQASGLYINEITYTAIPTF